MESVHDSFHDAYIAGLHLRENFGKHQMSCKVGTYCEFGFEQTTNQLHHHDCYELCIVADGHGSFLQGEKTYPLHKGDVLIADPGNRHEIRATLQDDLVLLYVFLDITAGSRTSGSYADKVIGRFLQGHAAKSAQPQLLAYLAFIEQYNTPRRRGRYGTSEAVKNLVIEALDALAGQSTDIPDGTEPVKNMLENAMDFIDANLHRKMSIQEVAAYCCTSQRNLQYLFRKHAGKTVIAHLHEKRINLACHYLTLRYSVSDTAAMVGMGSSSRFGKLFRDRMGVSPKRYQLDIPSGTTGMGRRI